MAARTNFSITRPSTWFAANKPTISAPKADKAGKVQTTRRAAISGLGQPQYLANTLDVNRINAALRSAERGDTWQLFTIFRDIYASYGHLQAVWSKRKLVITGNPEILIPADPSSEDDKIAVEVIRQMIDNCQQWNQAIDHLLDATLYPMAVAEKIYKPVESDDAIRLKRPLRYLLKQLAPVDPTLFCFKLPYQPSFSGGNDALRYDPDAWESWLRFYSVQPNGMVNYTLPNTYAPDPDVHVVHRGNMLSPTVPPNFGGQFRSILFPYLLSTQGRDWFAMLMQKYGQPIIIGKTNSSKKESVLTMQEAFAMATQLGGIVVDTKDTVDFSTISGSDLAEGHLKFQKWLDSHVSRIVGGESTSTHAEKTGMGSGIAQQAEEIREDYRKKDTMRLEETLRRQVFEPFLRINGYRGNPPHIRWGGMRSGDAANFAKTQAAMKSAGYIATNNGLRTINELMGLEYEIDPNATTPSQSALNNDRNQENANPGAKVKY